MPFLNQQRTALYPGADSAAGREAQLGVVSQFECEGMAAGNGAERIGVLNLRGIAQTVAQECGDKGCVVISFGDEGVRIGVENLKPEELREALCTAIHYSYVFEDEG